MKKRPLYGAALLLLLFFLALPTSLWMHTGPPEGRVAFTGTVDQREEREDMQVLLLKDTSILGARKILVYLRNSKQSYFIGNTLNIKGTIKQYKAPGNPGQFDSLLYYQRKKIDALCFGDAVEVLDQRRDGFREGLVRLQLYFSRTLEKRLGARDGGILKAMLLGDKRELPEEIRSLYQRSGISHLLAISGLHISILGAGLYRGLRRLGLPYGAAGIPALVLMGCYGVLVGAGVSTLRALTMFFLVVGADLIGRTYDIRTALGIAALWLLLEQPLYARDGAFLLSFGAVFGLTEVTPVLKDMTERLPAWKYFMGKLPGEKEKPVGEERMEGEREREQVSRWSVLSQKVTRFVREGLCACMGIQVVTLPVLLCCFYEVPVYAPILNLLVIPLMAPLLAAALALLALELFFPFAIPLTAWICHGILGAVEVMAKAFDRLPGAVFCGGCPKSWQIAVYYSGVGLLLFLWHREKRKRAKARERETEDAALRQRTGRKGTGLVLGYLLCMLMLLWRREPEFWMTMLDVGQGDAIFFATRGGNTYLMDGGSSSEKQTGSYILEPFFKYQGRGEADVLLVSHLDWDHISGITELLEEELLKVGCLVLPAMSGGTGSVGNTQEDEAYQKLKNLAKEKGIPVQVMGAGDCLREGDLVLRCLGPERGQSYENRNAASLVLSLEYKSLRVLLTGDLEGKGEARVLEQKELLGSYDILKVAHHGSQYSTGEEWLSQVRPVVGLISCGEENSYGHPHRELLHRLKERGCHTYMTPRDGAITIKSDGSSFEVETFRQSHGIFQE
ncbi:MAG: DUF4131 domain-containing protein [Lachnospiraceae bacterium]|nr:DUF4131 domain-containing protein [Lachnospiraceae bacterium]